MLLKEYKHSLSCAFSDNITLNFENKTYIFSFNSTLIFQNFKIVFSGDQQGMSSLINLQGNSQTYFIVCFFLIHK